MADIDVLQAMVKRIIAFRVHNDGRAPSRIVMDEWVYAEFREEVRKTGLPNWGNKRPRMFSGVEIVTTEEC
jgi:hypothetical protein